MALYWDIGRMIVERQGGQNGAKSVVQKLAADLQSEFPGLAGLLRLESLVDATSFY